MRATTAPCGEFGLGHGAHIGGSDRAGIERDASACGVDRGIAAAAGGNNVAPAALDDGDATADSPPHSERLGWLRRWPRRGHDGSRVAGWPAGADRRPRW